VNAEDASSTDATSPEIKPSLTENSDGKDKSEDKAADKTIDPEVKENQTTSADDSQIIPAQNASGEEGEANADDEQNDAAKDEPIEEEKQEFRKRNGDDKPLIADDFFYEYDELNFKPVISEDAKLPESMISLL